MTGSRSSGITSRSALDSQSTVRPTSPARASWDSPRRMRYQRTRCPMLSMSVIPRMR